MGQLLGAISGELTFTTSPDPRSGIGPMQSQNGRFSTNCKNMAHCASFEKAVNVDNTDEDEKERQSCQNHVGPWFVDMKHVDHDPVESEQ